MELFNRILVAVDFSTFSQEALRVAAGVARAYGCRVVALYVNDVPKGVDPALMVRSHRAISSLIELQKEAARVGRDKLRRWVGGYEWADAGVEVEVAHGRAHAAILEQARKMDADLIVMGAHGRSGFARMFIGTTAERVVRKAACAVLAVTLPKI